MTDTTDQQTKTPAVRFETPLQAYEAAQEEIRRLLKQIEAGLEAHDKRASANAGGHTWGHVGDLNGITQTLKDIKDRLHVSGEYKKIAYLR